MLHRIMARLRICHLTAGVRWDLHCLRWQLYMKGLDVKIKNVEKHAIVTELGTAVFVGSAQMILKLGIATVALVGGHLFAKEEIDVLTFFMFLLVVSRIYDPMQVSLQNLAAIIASDVQSARLDEILSHEVQEGTTTQDNEGYDIEFQNVRFSYNTGDVVLKDVTFTAKQGEVTALIGPSGGERQRLSIARAFLKDAPIILLDEATASLDVDNETMIQESLSRLIKNKTVMLIAHRMRTVADADKIVVLKDGVVAESGTPEELEKQNGIYANMVKTQLKVTDWSL